MWLEERIEVSLNDGLKRMRDYCESCEMVEYDDVEKEWLEFVEGKSGKFYMFEYDIDLSLCFVEDL